MFTIEFSYKNFEEEFADSMNELEKAFQEKDHLKTIRYLRFLSKAYYMINYKMADDRLEEITREISLDLLGETVIRDSKPETVVFYDGIGLANRGLSDIYVTALAQLGYQVVWILHDKGPKKVSNITTLQQRYAEKENVSFRIIPTSPILERMEILRDYIREAAPRHVFYYGNPDDICGIGTISTVKGDVTRYLIDLTDHAFWLGKCAVDYFIDFRNYGYNVAVQLRGISPERIVLLPFYPSSRVEYPFEGMPFDTEECEYVFSGGHPYKIEGDNTYQEMVEHILTNYPELKFVYAGKGKNQTLDYLKAAYPGQFFRIDERRDLDEVLKRAKLYLETYPITGGLMVQYALKNQCILLSLCGESMNDPKTWLLRPEKVNFVFYQKEALLSELDKLLRDKQYYEKAKTNLSEQVITEDAFAEELQRVMTAHTTKFEKVDMPINLDHFLEIYRKRADYGLFCKIIRDSHNDWVKRKYPEIMEEINRRET